MHRVELGEGKIWFLVSLMRAGTNSLLLCPMKVALDFLTRCYLSVHGCKVLLRRVVNGRIHVGLWVLLLLGAALRCGMVLARGVATEVESGL